MATLAGPWASAYINDQLLPNLARACRASTPTLDDVRPALSHPFRCLEAIYRHYAFSRRGKERAELSDIAVEALYRTTSEEDIPQFLAQSGGQALWANFEAVADERSKKAGAQLNQGPVAGLAELAQEIFRLDGRGSIVDWVVDAVDRSGHLEPEFLRMVDIRGVGPKLTSVFLRDIVFLFDLEDKVDFADRLYLQAVDKWLRQVAPHIIDEPGLDEAADWILSGKVAKWARHGGVSGVRLNMGITHFGVVRIGPTGDPRVALTGLLTAETGR
ncbi:MAG TPA: hypothetical protein PKA27_05105 [Fimbriimonadaceae bacterium]|nr:hypothetical protein [Fimbriimonadaceae bacterium]